MRVVQTCQQIGCLQVSWNRCFIPIALCNLPFRLVIVPFLGTFSLCVEVLDKASTAHVALCVPDEYLGACLIVPFGDLTLREW